MSNKLIPEKIVANPVVGTLASPNCCVCAATTSHHAQHSESATGLPLPDQTRHAHHDPIHHVEHDQTRHAHHDPIHHVEHDQSRHAHHDTDLKRKLAQRLNRIEGQVRGVQKMIATDVYCDDILNQISSIQAALNGVKKQLLDAHMRSCVIEQIQSGHVGVVDELMLTINKMLK